MNSDVLLDKIKSLPSVEKNRYSLFPFGRERYYYGKNWADETVFIIKSKNHNSKRYAQVTKELRLDMNVKSEFIINNDIMSDQVNIMTCTSNEIEKQIAFLRLCSAFVDANIQEEAEVIGLFNAFISLFSNKLKRSINELQGLFTELFVMYYFEQRDINLYKFWQKEDYRIHDFYVTDIKRIEIKSTSGGVRQHHFKHEQLLLDIHDVKVVSIFARRADKGLSLQGLIQKIRQSKFVTYSVLLHIERLISNYSEDELENIQFDEHLLDNSLEIFDAHKIPRFNEKQPNGLFNAEYDSDLSNINPYAISDFINWLGI